MADKPAPGTGRNYPEAPETPQTKTLTDEPTNNNIILTQEQFDTLLSRLSAGSTQDRAPAPSMSGGLRVNSRGEVVGTVQKFNIDPEYYSSPTEKLFKEPRLSRFSMEENYFLSWDITSKPYVTKDNLSVAEPTFHLTLYAYEFDDTGEPTERFIVIQTLHMNEDEEIAMNFAAEEGLKVTDEGMRELMDRTRYERAKRWLLDIFFPPRNFDLSQDFQEEAIGGTVVKVVTKSNVKGFGNKAPTIADEELS